jgi:hypothetical protein
MNDTYFKILNFVFLAKKLEYLVRQKYDYRGKSIFRGVIERSIPHKGDIELDGESFSFFFHGLGIDFRSHNRQISYNHYAGKDGLGVYFTLEGVFENNPTMISGDIQEQFDDLVKKDLIQKWKPEILKAEVYYLV